MLKTMNELVRVELDDFNMDKAFALAKVKAQTILTNNHFGNKPTVFRLLFVNANSAHHDNGVNKVYYNFNLNYKIQEETSV